MENKYYTPEIEEFHVGFECDIQPENIESFQSHRWCAENYFDLEASRFKVRVKYLDREDIESFGFEKDSGDYDYVNDNQGQLEILHEDNRGMMIDISTGYGACQEFYGRLKNKSELKKELKKIGL
jgi:hypothetical protein